MQHPTACAGLFARRIWTGLAHVRPFYSFRHNLAIAATLPLLYLLAIIGFIGQRSRLITWATLTIIGAHLTLIGLTWADWDGRFLLYVLPLMTLYSAVGAIALVHRLRARSEVTDANFLTQ